jgi:hypothetical protein
MLTQQEIARILAHDTATDERVRMVAKVQRKRAERERTVSRRTARAVKYAIQGR